MPISLSTNALVELSQLKSELGISGDSENDNLNRIINSISQQIEKYVGRKLYYEADIEEKVAGYGTNFLMVSRTPLISIDSITYSDATEDSNNYEIHGDGNSGLIYRPGGWVNTSESFNTYAGDPIAGTNRKTYTITYTGGYITQKQDTDGVGTRNLPYDIEDAALILSVSRYRKTGSSLGVKSESLLSGEVTYFDSSAHGIPEIVKSILNPYREIV